MPYEKGGRADKFGNRYETQCIIRQLIRVIEEKVASIQIEPIGDDEKGVDIWINEKDGTREAQQCKGRNASKEQWDITSLKARGIIEKSKFQLDRDPRYRFTLVSPVPCIIFEDIIIRIKNSNGSAKDFLNYQIMNKDTSKDVQEFFKKYCDSLKLNYENDIELAKIYDYLRRTEICTYSDTDVEKENLIDKIKYLFIGDCIEIYNLLKSYILESNILGKEITNTMLLSYLKCNGSILRNLTNDDKIIPRINELNREFKITFSPINKSLIQRKEFRYCRDQIGQGKSLIIHGKAGSGKSGCSQDIINYCEKENIPYISIKLDKRIPDGSAEKYGKELGFSASLAYCIDSISKNQKAIIILDQLDALRWTQNHSRNAIDVCSEMIHEVHNINKDRAYKISFVYICRTYDLENDSSIKLLFSNNQEIKWEKICIGNLEESDVKSIVGNNYFSLSSKLKTILQIPSNLYIWNQLDKEHRNNEIATANQLLSLWWDQLRLKCDKNNIDEAKIVKLKDDLVLLMNHTNKLFIPKMRLDYTVKGLDFLISNGMIMNIEGKIAFVHQNIYDYFLVENMLKRFWNGENIERIIGDKEKQTPARRYQVQMLLQLIEENNIEEFIEVGECILNSSEVRFYIKYVFLEILGQCNTISFKIKKFIHLYLVKPEFKEHILENVITGHKIYVEFLIDEGYIDKWFHENEIYKRIAINLLVSVSHEGTIKLVNTIRQYAFSNKDDDKMLLTCFQNYAIYDTEEMFRLRLEFYEKYPEYINTYNNIREVFRNSPERAIEIIELMLRLKINNQKNNIHRYEEEFLDESTQIIVHRGDKIIERLLPYVPLTVESQGIISSNWSSSDSFMIMS